MNFIWFIIIGVVAGFLAGKITKGHGSGLLLNLVIGVIGSVLGGWLFGLMGIAATGILGSLISATVGAILLLWIVAVMFGSKK